MLELQSFKLARKKSPEVFFTNKWSQGQAHE